MLTEGTPITTPSGEVPIEELQAGDVVLTYNHERGKVEPCRIVNARSKIAGGLYNLTTTAFQTIEVTGLHSVFYQGEYLPAKYLTPGTKLLSPQGTVRVKRFFHMPGLCCRVFHLGVTRNDNFFAGGVLVFANMARGFQRIRVDSPAYQALQRGKL